MKGRNGDAKWAAATDIAALIPKAPGLVAKYLPKLSYLLIEENRYSEADLAGLKNLVAAVIRLEHPESQESILRLVEELNDWLADNTELKRILAIWIRAVFLRQSRYNLVLPAVQDLKELKMTLAERFDTWAQQYRQEGIKQGIEKGIEKGIEQGIERGIEKGIEKGEALLLQKLLTKRFGALPTDIVGKIGAASAAQIDVWGERVLEAASLEDVFRP